MNPKMGFVIMRDDDLADTRRCSLDLLYQPLLRPIGYALINLLWRLGEISSNSLFQRPIGDLLAYLNVDINRFKEALHQIEGAGLIRFFKEQNPDHLFYVFYLIQPRSAREFFKDDLLSVGLLETIGDNRFLKLSQALIPRPYQFRDVHDLTRDFLEVYTVGHKHLTDIPKTIKQIRSGIHAKMTSSLKDDRDLIDESPDFDFKMLMKIIKNDSYTDPVQVSQHRRLILTEHALYGLDELAMANYIGKATSVATNKVDFTKFRTMIAKAYQGNQRKPIRTKYHSAPSSARKNNGDESKLKHDEQGLIKAADYYSPVQFLHHLKKELNPNSIITHSEELTLGQALQYSAFPDNRGVINILVYYCIAEKKMPTLNSTFMQYMITAWNQAKVNTPADALAEIQAHRQKNVQRWRNYKSKRNHPRYNYRNQPRIKQKLPKWARSDYHVKLHPTSQKLQRKIKQQLNSMNHQPNHRKGGHK